MKSLILFASLISAFATHAEIRTEVVEYKDGDTVLEGYLAFDAKKAAKRPGILVIHEWTGINANIKRHVEDLAKLGYTAFAADIYGKGVRPTDPKDAAATSNIYKSDRSLMRRRALAALAVLQKHKTVNGKTAAIGFCFGGTTALELARAGAGTLGTVSFHGGLSTPNAQDAKNIKGKILVLHGADDKFVPSDEVQAFENEMRAAGVDWQLVKYSKAVHSFTNPEAGNDPSKGTAYNAEADKRSWHAMQDFFTEIFR